MVDLFRYKHWDLVSHRGIYYFLSLLMLAIGVFAMIMNYQKTHECWNLGIDFKGGGLVTYTVQGRIAEADNPLVIQEIRESLQKQGIENEVQISPSAVAGSGDQVLIHTLLAPDSKVDLDAQLQRQIKDNITGTVGDVLKTHSQQLDDKMRQPVAQDVVGKTISDDLIKKGVLAIVLGSLLIMGWIGIRYNIGGFGMRYSVTGILALFHDLLTLVGMFAIFHKVLQVNSPFIAALLTVLGYSIHDTIVIFDRIRENMRLRKGRTFAEIVNTALLETMARSVNTILTVLFTLLALFFFGGPTIRDFTAAMLIGVIVGGYSSIFIASQLLVTWSKGKERIILPPGEEVIPGKAAPQPAYAGAPAPTLSATSAAHKPAVPKDAITAARQSGKTARRKRS